MKSYVAFAFLLVGCQPECADGSCGTGYLNAPIDYDVTRLSYATVKLCENGSACVSGVFGPIALGEPDVTIDLSGCVYADVELGTSLTFNPHSGPSCATPISVAEGDVLDLTITGSDGTVVYQMSHTITLVSDSQCSPNCRIDDLTF